MITNPSYCILESNTPVANSVSPPVEEEVKSSDTNLVQIASFTHEIVLGYGSSIRWYEAIKEVFGSFTTFYQVKCHSRTIKLYCNIELAEKITKKYSNELNVLKEIQWSIWGSTGIIPRDLGTFIQLRQLSLLGSLENKLEGEIPAELGQLKNLEELNLGFNNLSGEIPDELGNLSELKKLILGYNNLSGSIPRSLGQLKKLKQLGLYNNKLTGSIPSELGDLPDLFFLDLSKNNLSGLVPEKLKEKKKVILLWKENPELK